MRTRPSILGLVFVGGALGSLARFGLGEILLSDFWLLLVVNTLGSLLIGWANAHPRMQSESAKAFVSIGFAGGFTTMSGLAVFIVSSGQLWAALYVFVVGLFGYWLGTLIGGRRGGAR